MLSIRRATLDDVDAVVALVHSAYRGEPSRAGWTTEADWIDGVRTNACEVADLVTGPDSLLLLVEDASGPGPVLEASCALERSGAGVANFGMFAVRPDRQAQGTGRLLLAEAERFVRHEWHTEVMRMTVVDVRDELIGWYERRGYRSTGELLPFPYDDPAFGIPRVPGLRFAVLEKPLAAGDEA